MEPVTKEQLQRYAPQALPEYVDVLVAGAGSLAEAGVNNPLRWCHFIAQLAHETMGLRIKRENTAWTPAQMKMLWPSRFPLGGADPRIMACRGDPEKLANLAYASTAGNLGGDDGWRYRGGSFIQLTGRENYGACGLAIGVALEEEPELIEQPEVGLAAAIWEWGKHPNNEFADRNYGRAIGNAINRGNPFSAKEPNGAASRRQWFDRAWALWGEGLGFPDDSILHLGACGPKVSQVQEELKALGYPVGAVDGVLGPAMARAVAGFKLDQKRLGTSLEPEEAVGPLTLAALINAAPAPLSPDRTQATPASLAAAGSTEVATGRRSQALGRTAVITAGMAGAGDVGLLDAVKDALSWLPGMQMTVAPVIAAVQWGLKNALWVAVLVGGVWLYIKGRDVVLARLEAHRTGANLGR
jgi:putative chitinase